MANHKSAVKQHRQSLARRERNRNHRSRVRTAVKKCRQAIAVGDVDLARSLLPRTLSLLDRTAKLHAIRDQASSRTKSRLARAVNRMA